MKKLLIALLSIATFASCKKDVIEGSGYAEQPILWINGSSLSEGQTYFIGSSNDIKIKAKIKLKTNCSLYCEVTIIDIGPDHNQTIGKVYGGNNLKIPISFVPEKPDGSNVEFVAVPSADVASAIKNNYYICNLVFTGPDIGYYFQRSIQLKRY